jgi:peptide/nickel transport system permease protein
LKNTIFINIFATILGLGITIPLGIFCAVKRGSKRDVAVQVGTIIGYSLPTYIIAIVFIWLFAIILGWFPVSGMQTAGSLEWSAWDKFWDKMYHFSLPLIVMTFTSLGGMTRYVRASMIEALSMDCIRTARAKGLKEKVVIYKHAFRNTLIPLVTSLAGLLPSLFSGAIITEQVFGLPGIGNVALDAMNRGDIPFIMGYNMFLAMLSVIGVLLADVMYAVVDPRVKLE